MRSEGAPRARRWQRLRYAQGLLAIAPALCAPACLIEDKCDANQVYLDADHQATCICAPNTVSDPKGYGCIPCGEHEMVTGTVCVCEPGFAKPPGGATCEPVVGQELGAACTGTGTCTEPYPYCATDGADKYCTDQCVSNTDCPLSYRCETGFCAKVTGLGEACTKSEDCAGTDSLFCNTFAASTCVVDDCAGDTSKCPNGSVCCAIGTNSSCAVGTTCMPPTMLVP